MRLGDNGSKKRLTLDLDLPVQRRLRAVAAIKGTCIRQYCLTAISKAVYQEFYPATSKAIIHEIDRVLARHYSCTEEELDFIINYDTKYRMGRIE